MRAKDLSAKARMTVTIDETVLKTIDKERGDLITRSRYVDYLLKLGILTLRKEQKETVHDGV